MSQKKGKEGEEISAIYLKDNGYKIITKNFYSYFGEIDIIAKLNQTLIFFEVKHYKKNSLIHPLYYINKKKQKNIIQTAKFYLLKNNIQNTCCQFDVIIIQDKKVTAHIKDSFQVS
ncbi:MAG: YraN family protein [bacterium]